MSQDAPASPSALVPAQALRVPVVGIGASAGGLEALISVLGQVPRHCGLAFAVVQHLDPLHKAMLAPLLQRATTMTVHEAVAGQRIEADQVYVIPPNKTMTVEQGLLRLAAPAEPRGLRRPIDALFESLADEYADRAVAVVLSGMASDGTAGLKAIRARGGLTLAQLPGSAQFDATPRSAMAAGCVDIVCEASEMPGRILAELWDRRVLPAKPGADGEGLRAWVAGCSASEEADSLAIALRETADATPGRETCTLQVFATDLSHDAIDRARRGLFAASISSERSAARLARCFNPHDGGFRVHKSIRETIVFAPHDLTADPPLHPAGPAELSQPADPPDRTAAMPAAEPVPLQPAAGRRADAGHIGVGVPARAPVRGAGRTATPVPAARGAAPGGGNRRHHRSPWPAAGRRQHPPRRRQCARADRTPDGARHVPDRLSRPGFATWGWRRATCATCSTAPTSRRCFSTRTSTCAASPSVRARSSACATATSGGRSQSWPQAWSTRGCAGTCRTCCARWSSASARSTAETASGMPCA